MKTALYSLCFLIIFIAKSMAQNVGIGTNYPLYKLDVAGNGSYRSNAMSLVSNRVTGGVLLVNNADGNEQTLRLDGNSIQATYTNPLIFPVQTVVRPLTINPYGGNVGIGNIAAPAYKLHIWSTGEELLKIDGTNSLVVFHDRENNGQYGFFRLWTKNPFNPAGYYGMEMGVPTANAGEPAKRLMFSTSYTLRMMIMENGNVGINNNAPVSKLDVGGSLSLPIRKITAAGTHTITDDDYTIILDFNNQAKEFSVRLPSPVGRKGRLYTVSAVKMPLNNSSSGGVYDNTGYLMATFYYSSDWYSSAATFQSDGSEWFMTSYSGYSY